MRILDIKCILLIWLDIFYSIFKYLKTFSDTFLVTKPHSFIRNSKHIKNSELR